MFPQNAPVRNRLASAYLKCVQNSAMHIVLGLGNGGTGGKPLGPTGSNCGCKSAAGAVVLAPNTLDIPRHGGR